LWPASGGWPNRSSLVDRKELAQAQAKEDLVRSEGILRDAFFTDVRPALAQWRKGHKLAADPIEAPRRSGYEKRVAKERVAKYGAKGDGGYA